VIIFDFLSHGLWGGLIFGRRSSYWLALSFGVMPDVLSFGPLMIIRIMEGVTLRGAPGLNTIPPWVFTLYSLTHSLIIAGIIVCFLFYINKKVGIAAGAWILHILMDIPVHTQGYFPTPFLYPLSNFTFNGVNSIKLWAVNWLILILFYIYFYLRSKNYNHDI
jgi:hypothetical protein